MYFTGFVRLSNVEFLYAGQGGFIEHYDARFALTIYNTGMYREAKPSTVHDCSFHHLYSTAIGNINTMNLEIMANVVYQSVGTCEYLICITCSFFNAIPLNQSWDILRGSTLMM